MVKGKAHSGACLFNFDGSDRGRLVCWLDGEHRTILLYRVNGVEVLKEMYGLGILVRDALEAAVAIQG